MLKCLLEIMTRLIHLARTQHFPKNLHSLHPDRNTYVSVSGGKKYQFSSEFCIRTNWMILTQLVNLLVTSGPMKSSFFANKTPDSNNWSVRDRLQLSLLIFSQFKRINKLLFPLKSSDNLWFSYDFRGDRS